MRVGCPAQQEVRHDTVRSDGLASQVYLRLGTALCMSMRSPGRNGSEDQKYTGDTMNTNLTAAVAAERVADLHRAALRDRRAHESERTPPLAGTRRRRVRPRFAWLMRRPADA